MWGCIFAMPLYSVGFIIFRMIVPMPVYLTILLSPFVTGNILLLLYAFWLLRKANKDLKNPAELTHSKISKN